jgi:Putative excisionase (DUF1233)
MFVTAKEITAITAIAPSTLRRLRQTEWVEGAHFCVLGYSSIIYNAELIRDWIANKHQPELHEQAIQSYLSNLPSQKRPGKKPGRRS